MNSKEKFKNWLEKAVKGEKGYEAIISQNSLLQYYYENYKDEAEQMAVVIWKDNQPIYYFSKGADKKSEVPEALSIVIKKEKKMIFYDGKEMIYTFGLENEDENIMIMIFYQFHNSGSFIIGSSRARELQIFNYLKNTDPEPVELFTTYLLKQIETVKFEIESEVNTNAGESK